MAHVKIRVQQFEDKKDQSKRNFPMPHSQVENASSVRTFPRLPACFPYSSPLAASWRRRGTNDQAATIPPSKHHNHLLHLLLLHSRSRMTRPQYSLLHFCHFSPPALHLLLLGTSPTMTSLPQSHRFLCSPPPSMVLVGELSFLTVPQFFQR